MSNEIYQYQRNILKHVSGCLTQVLLSSLFITMLLSPEWLFNIPVVSQLVTFYKSATMTPIVEVILIVLSFALVIVHGKLIAVNYALYKIQSKLEAR